MAVPSLIVNIFNRSPNVGHALAGFLDASALIDLVTTCAVLWKTESVDTGRPTKYHWKINTVRALKVQHFIADLEHVPADCRPFFQGLHMPSLISLRIRDQPKHILTTVLHIVA